MQREFVDSTFEVDHFAHRLPKVRPAPLGEFGFVRGVEADRGHRLATAQQIPALFLTDAQRQLVVTDELARQTVAQPTARHTEHFDLRRLQADFFEQLTVHRLLGALAAPNATLRKLPTFAAGATTEKHAPEIVAQHDADVGAKTLVVDVVGHARVACRLRRSSR